MRQDDPERPACPTCRMPMTPIVYGLVGVELRREAERGEIILGGCVIEPGDARWGCRTCNESRDDVPDFMRR